MEKPNPQRRRRTTFKPATAALFLVGAVAVGLPGRTAPTPAQIALALVPVAAILVVLIVHEGAHAAAASAVGARHAGITFGVGPVIAETQFGGRTYTLRALPIAGSTAVENMHHLPPRQVAIIALAGPAANLAMAVTLETVSYLHAPMHPTAASLRAAIADAAPTPDGRAVAADIDAAQPDGTRTMHVTYTANGQQETTIRHISLPVTRVNAADAVNTPWMTRRHACVRRARNTTRTSRAGAKTCAEQQPSPRSSDGSTCFPSSRSTGDVSC